MKKVTITCSEDELSLIERALELYTRIGLGQFEEMTLVYSLQQEIRKDKTGELVQNFDNKTKELRTLFNLSINSYWGIFNKENVHDDVRIAAHLQQTLRYQRYRDRMNSGEQTERHHTVDEYPADICQIAGMNLPNFKVTIENE